MKKHLPNEVWLNLNSLMNLSHDTQIGCRNAGQHGSKPESKYRAPVEPLAWNTFISGTSRLFCLDAVASGPILRLEKTNSV